MSSAPAPQPPFQHPDPKPYPGYGETRAQRDAFAAFQTRVEQVFDSTERLGALEAEVRGADMEEFDRETLLGRIDQYRIDLERSALDD
jgi:hypothetical protein